MQDAKRSVKTKLPPHVRLRKGTPLACANCWWNIFISERRQPYEPSLSLCGDPRNPKATFKDKCERWSDYRNALPYPENYINPKR